MLIILFLFSFGLSAIGQGSVNSQLSFNLAPTYFIGTDTTDTDLVDLDEDGNLDAVVGHNDGETKISILYGNGNGGFNNPVDIQLNGIYASAISSGDLNNDGRPDLVFVSFYQNRIAVLANLGNRQFAPPVISIPPDPPNNFGELYDVAIADFDGDGNNEVVALQDQSGKRLRFFRYNIDGTLTVFKTLDHIWSDTNRDGIMSIGDINGDNIADIVLCGGSSSSRNVSFVFGRKDGNFSSTLGFWVNDLGQSIRIADLDGDGNNDLAIAFYDTTTPTQHSLRPFKNNGNSTFSFGPIISLDYPFPPWDITSGDFNNDGKIDLAAIIFQDCIMVTYGMGNLIFGSNEYYMIPPSSRIISADLNRDDKLDFFTASSIVSNYNSASVIINDNSHGFKAPSTVLWGAGYIASADFNNDGYNDLATAWGSYFNTNSTVNILLNNYTYDGSFLPEVSYDTTNGLSGVKTGDFNGDGKSDIVANHDDNSRRLAVYLGDGTGTVATPPINTTFPNGIKNTLVADFNSDGKDDVFAADNQSRGYVMLSSNNGNFIVAEGSPFIIPDYRLHFQVTDFNRDTFLDIISETGIYLGDGTGRFVLSSISFPIIRNITIGDFNSDGNPDIAGAAGNNTTGTLKGFFGDGKGGILGEFSQDFSGDAFTVNGMVSADFDLDGFVDVALLMRQDDVYRLNEMGNLVIITSGGNTPSWKTPIYYKVGSASLNLIAKDFNADGKTDLAYLGGLSRGVFFNTSIRTKKAPFDFDGDSKSDISIFRPNVGQWWYLKSGDGGNAAFAFGNSSDVLTPGDFTGDGKTDICFFRPSESTWYILRSEDSSFFSFPFGALGDIPAPADFDGDGKSDAAVFRPSNQTWYIQRSSDGITSTQGFGLMEDKPVVADYDGDGKADIAIFRPSNGQWWYQKSGNGQITALQFGTSTDRPIQGDYTGDGKADIGFFRPSTGEWFILRSEDFSFFAFPFGTAGDIPAPGDYDGDGKIDPAIFRPSSNTWYINRSTSGLLVVGFGVTGDQPVPSAFIP